MVQWNPSVHSSTLSLLNILPRILPRSLKMAASALDIRLSHHITVISRLEAHTPICDYVTNLGYVAFHSKRNFADVIRVTYKIGRKPWFSSRAQSNNTVLQSRELVPAGSSRETWQEKKPERFQAWERIVLCGPPMQSLVARTGGRPQEPRVAHSCVTSKESGTSVLAPRNWVLPIPWAVISDLASDLASGFFPLTRGPARGTPWCQR